LITLSHRTRFLHIRRDPNVGSRRLISRMKVGSANTTAFVFIHPGCTADKQPNQKALHPGSC
jgi:hypothetical protein